jgi:hypothetical protein
MAAGDADIAATQVAADGIGAPALVACGSLGRGKDITAAGMCFSEGFVFLINRADLDVRIGDETEVAVLAAYGCAFQADGAIAAGVYCIDIVAGITVVVVFTAAVLLQAGGG